MVAEAAYYVVPNADRDTVSLAAHSSGVGTTITMARPDARRLYFALGDTLAAMDARLTERAP